MRIRAGSMLLEVSLAIALVTVALVAVANLLAVASRQNHESRLRAVATREVANVAELVMATPWEKTTADQFTDAKLDAASRGLLREATLDVEVTDVSNPHPAKRIRVSLAYRDMAGQLVTPISLVTWKFQPGDAE